MEVTTSAPETTLTPDVITDKMPLRRIDALRQALQQLINQQQSSGAVSDTYSLVTFSNSTYQARILCRRASDVKEALSRPEDFQPSGHIHYESLVNALPQFLAPGNKVQVVFLSDGCPSALQAHVLPELQLLAAKHLGLTIHTVGLGLCDFMILQQVLQIGRGTFSQASYEMDNLVNTFTTLSHTITVTRQIARNERTVRAVAFDSARRYGKTPVFALKRWSEAERVKFTLAHGTLKEVGRKKCLVAMHQNPIMQGAMRVVHHFRDTRKKAPMVAKFSKFVEHDDSLDYVRLFVKNTLQTRMLAHSFQHALAEAFQHKAGRARERRRQSQLQKLGIRKAPEARVPQLVCCTRCFVYQGAVKGAPSNVFIAEEFLRGSAEQGFVKWINNRGRFWCRRAARTTAWRRRPLRISAWTPRMVE
ncbi:unnamed protein product [Effrenium voratum]|uniref:Alpha-type protein kinase domain-containing protein n=1 Tax=Effrenium voratum TaxID=2562239 RepID=A0AA36JFC7_9DINO|nr:unnamed protein product [Effrenium voratum]